MYIHDYTGMEISQDAYMALSPEQQRNYRHKRKTEEIVSDAVVDIVTHALLDEFLDTNNIVSTNSFDATSDSSGFDGGFGGGDFSGGGAGGDF